MIGAVLIHRLERFGPLPDQERRSVEGAALPVVQVEARSDLVREGERSSPCPLLLEGFACHYKVVEDGQRQITAFHVPGDFCDLAGLHSGRPGHSVCTLTPARVTLVPRATLLGWMRRHPRLNEALWRAASVDAAISREWLVSVGRRTAYQRTAHLLCELALRLRSAGLADGATCELPLTQAELADALGITPVHTGRMLRQLRAAGLIEIGGGTLLVRDWPGLRQAGDFDPAYLQQPDMAA